MVNWKNDIFIMIINYWLKILENEPIKYTDGL